ncbi:hypothetical protein CDL12_08371 [Handroanthus impetiginosus]|uniref:Uncharacterized protein n=1 Tax=Handroanthus impetiginosus TaxID=429701 RepID=A0A2G9HN60_9LAMI|nr:hypothetical protein CDL12_08371 [Handroanthus impetiginosus]
MGRGRTKGRKVSTTNEDDTGSGEEERIPVQKRRGRPQKSPKDEIDEDEVQKMEEEDSEDATKTVQNEKKRRRNAHVKEKVDLATDQDGNGARSSAEESSKSNGFRQNGNRRKSTPRRAAESIVECN